MAKFEEYYPHDQKINMTTKQGKIFALLFAGKLVAIGIDNGRDGVDILASVIDNSKTKVQIFIDHLEKNDDPGVRLLYDKIRNRKLASKDTLPEPSELIYQCGEYRLYQHAWWKRHKFEIRKISDSENTWVFGGNDIQNISNKLSELTGRSILLR